MAQHDINIDPIVEYLEEGIACYDGEHPGYNVLAEAARSAVESYIALHGSFDIDDEEAFDTVVEMVAV